MSVEFEPRDVVWTTDKIERFWEDIGPRDPEQFFSAQVAPNLSRWIVKTLRPNGRVVDLGCGRGDLLEQFKSRGYEVHGIDSSPASVRATEERLGRGSASVGAVSATGLATGSAGVVLLVETIEHILEPELRPMLEEIRRVLAPGGNLVVTTPNGEDLQRNFVRCPDCGAAFHRMQHVRSLNALSLKGLLHDAGFGAVRIHLMNLAPGTGWFGTLRQLANSAKRARPHLIAVATR